MRNLDLDVVKDLRVFDVEIVLIQKPCGWCRVRPRPPPGGGDLAAARCRVRPTPCFSGARTNEANTLSVERNSPHIRRERCHVLPRKDQNVERRRRCREHIQTFDRNQLRCAGAL